MKMTLTAISAMATCLVLQGCQKQGPSTVKSNTDGLGTAGSSSQHELGAPEHLLLPFVVSDDVKNNIGGTKLVHIYVTNDSREMSMQLAVQYDLEQLQAACNGNPNINWVALIGSHIATSRASGPAMKKQELVPACVSGQRTLFPGLELSPAPADASDFPWLTPSNLKTAIQFVRTKFEDQGANVSYFLTVKSHGAPTKPLIGFTQSGIKKKVDISRSRIGSAFDKVMVFGSVGWQRSTTEGLIHEVRLDPAQKRIRDCLALGRVDDQTRQIADGILRDIPIADRADQLGCPEITAVQGKQDGQSATDGSGISDGGGIANEEAASPESSPIRTLDRNQFWDEIDAAFTQKSKARLLGMFIDACEPTPLTNDEGRFMQTAKKGYLHKIYYSRGVSWYRSINFDEIYSKIEKGPAENTAHLFLDEFDKQAKRTWVWPLSRREMK